MNVIEIYDENDQLVAWMTDEGVIGGENAGDINVSENTLEIESSSVTRITGNVTVYYDGSSWTKIASYYDGQAYEWKDFNGAYVLNRECPFNLRFKDAEGNESVVYKVIDKGVFLFHEDGTWEKIGE